MPESAALETLTIKLSLEELDLLRTALRMLRWTLGRDEAGELDEIRLLLERLEALSKPHG